MWSGFLPQIRCVLATWSLCVRTERSASSSLWSATASSTVKTVLMRTPGTPDVVSITLCILVFLSFSVLLLSQNERKDVM